MATESHHAATTAETLPQEALAALFLVLPIHNAGIACQVCKSWAAIGSSDEVWRRRAISVCPELASRPTVNALLRSIPDDELIPYRIVTDEHGEKSHRLFWREIFFLVKRVSQVVRLFNETIKPNCASILNALPTTKRPRAKKSKSPTLRSTLEAAAAKFDSISVSIKWSDVDDMMRLAESLVLAFSPENAESLLDELTGQSAGARAKIKKLLAQTYAVLQSLWLFLDLEVCVQLIARDYDLERSFEKISDILRRGSESFKEPEDVKPFTSDNFIPVLFTQAQRLISTAARHASSPSASNFVFSILSDTASVITDWIPFHAKPVGRLLKVTGKQGPTSHAIARLLQSCMQAYSALIGLEGWDKDLQRTLSRLDDYTEEEPEEEMSSSSSSSVNVAAISDALRQLDCLVDAVSEEVKEDEAFFNCFLHAAQLFREESSAKGEPKWSVESCIFRVLSALSPNCPNSITTQFQLIVDQFIVPATTSSHPTLRKAAAICISQFVYGISEDTIWQQIPYLLRLLLPMTFDSEMGDFARTCSINVWNAVHNADISQLNRDEFSLKAVAEEFILNSIERIERLEGDWSSCTLALGFAANALHESFIPHYARAMRAVVNAMKQNAKHENAAKLRRCLHATSYLIDIPDAKSVDHKAIWEIPQLFDAFVSMGIIGPKDRILLMLASSIMGVVPTNTAAQLFKNIKPLLIAALSDQPDIQLGQNPDFGELDEDGEVEHHITITNDFLQRLESGITAVQKITIKAWDAMWPDFRAVCDAMRVAFERSFAPEIQSRAAAIYSDLVVSLLKRVSNISGEYSHYSEEQRSQMHAEAAPALMSILSSLCIGDQIQPSVLQIVAESIHDVIGAVPPSLAMVVSSEKLFFWIMSTLEWLIPEVHQIRSELEATWNEEQDDEETGPGSQPFERSVEAETIDHRESALWMYHAVQAAHKLDPSILNHFRFSAGWHTEEIISDPIGAIFAVAIAVLIMEKCPADSIVGEYDTYVRLVLDGCQSPSPYVAQSCVCGVGVAAGVFPEKFQASILPAALENLDAVWNFDTGDDASLWKSVLENASSSYGKILSACKGGHVSDLTVRSELFKRFYSLLPYTDDPDEIKHAVRTLVALFEQKEPAIAEHASDPQFIARMKLLLVDHNLLAKPELHAKLKSFLDPLFA